MTDRKIQSIVFITMIMHILNANYTTVFCAFCNMHLVKNKILLVCCRYGGVGMGEELTHY